MATKSNSEIYALVSNAINAIDITTFDLERVNIFKYEGFDPLAIAVSLYDKKTEMSLSDSDFANDIVDMIGLGIYKGSVNSHNLKKMSGIGKGRAEDLMKRYDIKSAKPGSATNSKLVTFPRIMAAFPQYTIQLTIRLGGKDYIGGPMQSYELPDCMKSQVFPSILPIELDKDLKTFLMRASIAYGIDQTVAIANKQSRGKDLFTLFKEQERWTLIAANSSVPPNEDRLNLFRSLKLDYIAINKVVSVLKGKVPEANLISLSEAQFNAMIKKVS